MSFSHCRKLILIRVCPDSTVSLACNCVAVFSTNCTLLLPFISILAIDCSHWAYAPTAIALRHGNSSVCMHLFKMLNGVCFVGALKAKIQGVRVRP